LKAQDIMNQNNERGRVLKLLRDFCDQHDLSYSYKEKNFTVKLPKVEELPTANIVNNPGGKKRFRFGFLEPNPKGLVEGADDNPFPDELPPTTTPLEEGEAPEGDDEA
jgi:hypothetical protein